MVALVQGFGFSVSIVLTAIVNYAYYILFVLIIAWILISWFPNYPSNTFLQRIYDLVGNVVDPIMRPIRRLIPPLSLGGMALDLSPMIALFALSVGRQLLLVMIAGFVRPVAG